MTSVIVDFMPDPAVEAFDTGGALQGWQPRELAPVIYERIGLLAETWKSTTPSPEDRSVKLVYGELPDGRLAIFPRDYCPGAKIVMEDTR